VYAPALVAFLGDPGVVVGAAGVPVSWVPLGWGEPVVPWWRRGHGPSWRGWGGPRVVNNLVVTNTTVVNVENITVYRNAGVPRAVVAVDRERFGHGPITGRRIVHVDGQHLRPLPGAPQIAATPSSLVPSPTRGIRPPEATVKRLELEPERVRRGRDAVREAKPELQAGEPLPRPRFGRGPTERPMADRKTQPAPPRAQAGPAATPSAPHPPADRAPHIAPVPKPEPARPPSASSPVVGSRPAGAGPGHRPEPSAAARQAAPVSSPPARKGELPAMTPTPTPAPQGVRPSPRTAAPEQRVTAPKGPGAPGSPAATGYSGGRPPAQVTRPDAARRPGHPLPGEPANRMAPGRGQGGPARPDHSQGQSK
jgi:hypothetical protein